MNPVWVILQREYFSRVKKKSFLIMTILGPILIGLFYGVIGFIMTRDTSGDDVSVVSVRDESGILNRQLDSMKGYRFQFTDLPADSLNSAISKGEVDAFLWIRDRDGRKADSISFTASEVPGPAQKKDLERHIETALYNIQLKQAGLRKGFLDSLKTSASINTITLGEDGKLENTSTEVKAGIGFALSFIIYIFIFMYGVMVMRSVQEEKTNRIVEILASSVKPFQLMLGKICGIALVALTQFAIWILLSFLIITLVSSGIDLKSMAGEQAAAAGGGGAAGAMQAFQSLPFFRIGGLFIFYFLGGYLLYASFLAAIGAAVDQETDTQQFMFPMTMPLIFAMVIASRVVFDDPFSTTAVWASIIPFTSPIVMVVRSGFDVPWWELLLSMGLLVMAFLGMVWVAGRIYRTGILMYGKKVTWKELGKWIFYKG
jgi:ABC-2 type transport system permease protein